MAITCFWVFFIIRLLNQSCRLSFKSSPLFFLSSRSLARVRVRWFSFLAFTSSPGVHISLSLSGIGVKTFVFYPSPFHVTCLVPADCPFSLLSCWHNGPISRAGADAPEGEGFLNKVFIHIVLNHSEMCRVGEGVKAKNEKHLTRTRAREREERKKTREELKGSPQLWFRSRIIKNTQEHVIAIQREITTFAIETISNNLSSI